MTTVALVGPDGAGKTTVARRIERELGLPVAYLYMGVNPDAGEHQLPTTRLVWAIRRRTGRRPETGPPAAATTGSVQSRTGARRQLRSLLRAANLIVEEAYRSTVVRLAERRGNVVVFDRHYFLDYYAHDVTDRRADLGRRLHGWFLATVLRKPDLVIYLEAPAAVLHRRKGEGAVADLQRRQEDYERAFAELPRVERVDASRSLDAVVADVRDAILGFVGARPR